MSVDVIVLLYGLFLYSGAYFGYKAGSNMSLIMGLLSGTLVTACWTQIGRNPDGAYGVVTLIAVLLGMVFLKRLLKTKKFMPAGMLLSVTVAFLIFVILQLNIV